MPEGIVGIRHFDRVLVVAPTEGGKSTLVNYLTSAFRVQRVIVDTKGGEWAVPGVTPVADVEAIDWTQPVIHFVDRYGRLDEYEALFAELNQRRNVLAIVHEMGDLCEHQPNRTPTEIKRYLTKGRVHGRGWIGASQRPVGMPVHARTEVQHIFVMTPGLSRDDITVVAPLMNMTPRDLAGALAECHERFGQFSFLWYPRSSRPDKPIPCPPLPAHVRAQSLVRARKLA